MSPRGRMHRRGGFARVELPDRLWPERVGHRGDADECFTYGEPEERRYEPDEVDEFALTHALNGAPLFSRRRLN